MPGKGFGDMLSGKVKTLSISDANMLAKQSFLDSVTPNTSTSGVLTYENISLSASLKGGGVGSFDVNGLKLEEGRIYDEDEVLNSDSVALIDQNTKNSIFKNDGPIGKIILFRAKSKTHRLNLSEKFEKERPSLRSLIYQISSDEKVIWRQNRPRRDDGRRDETRDDDFF